MPSLNEFEDETDREHARLDMHRVNDRTMHMDQWWVKWGDKVETFLRTGSQLDFSEDDLVRAEREAVEAGEEAATLRGVIERSIRAWDAMITDGQDRVAVDLVNEIFGDLENAL